MTLTRRDLLRLAPVAAAPLLTGRVGAEDPPRNNPAFPGMIVRMEQPRNLETPMTALNADLKTDHFFIRSHFAVPKLDTAAFKLVVEGLVAKRLELSLDDLKQLPTVVKSMTLECAGNGRVFLTPQAQGVAVGARGSW